MNRRMNIYIQLWQQKYTVSNKPLHTIHILESTPIFIINKGLTKVKISAILGYMLSLLTVIYSNRYPTGPN